MNARPIQCEDSSAGWGEPRAYRNRTPLSALWGLGTFAEAMTVSERSVVKVETDLPFEQLALLGCSVTTGLGAVFNAAHVAPGNTVVVIGCGGVGQAIVQGARISGAARIIAVDPALLKREAAHRVGATDVVDPLACDPVEAVLELTGARRGVDIAFEAVGRSSLIRQAWQMTRPGGLAVVVGIPPDEPIDIGGLEFVVSGRRIMPSMNAEGFSKVEVPRFLSLVERGLVDLEGMISRNISLQNIKQCFENLDHIAVLRSVITF
jgi:S-(hydroxymethyl)glutathione dehydrogenase/alcohol dehydrogenase